MESKDLNPPVVILNVEPDYSKAVVPFFAIFMDN